MEALLLLLGKAVALALEGVDVEHHRAVRVLYAAECLNERRHIVALCHINVVEAHGFEEVARRLAVSVAKELQIVVKATVVFGNRHLVVVDHNNHVRVQLGSNVETLKRLAAAQRPVANHGNHIEMLAAQVARLRQSRSQTHRS